MNDAKLILDIGADVSQFEYSLAKVRDEIKKVTKDIESATGAEFSKLSVDLTGLERTEDTLTRFGQFAEGTLGALKNQLATLKQERLEIPIGDTSKLEEWNRRIDETVIAIKNLEGLGKQKILDVVQPSNLNSIQYFREELDRLNKLKVTISIDTAEGRKQMALINNTIEYYQGLIKDANSLGKSFDPIPQDAVNSINYFKQQVDSLTAKRASISIDTLEGRAEIASLTNLIDEFLSKIAEIQNIGKSAEFIDLNTLNGLYARLSEINKLKARVNLDDEGEIARLNAEAEQLLEQINRVNNLGFDSQGQISTGAARARQSITNFGLVLQDLPFGFIAIQNNIPNLINSFQQLQISARSTGTTVTSLITQQFSGASGAVLGLGLGISALVSVITALVQEYGSLGAAIDAVIAKSISLEDINRKVEKSYLDVTKSTAGEAANLRSLLAIYTDATTSQEALRGVKSEINKDYPSILAFIEDENRLTAESAALIEERTKALLQQSILEGRRQGLIKLISEETAKGEKSILDLTKLVKNELGLVETLGLAFRSLFVPLKAGPQGMFQILSTEIDNAAKSITVYKGKLDIVNNAYVKLEAEVLAVVEALKKKEKQDAKEASEAEKAAAQRLRELERYRDALLKFSTLKIDVFEISDDTKIIDKKIKSLEKYGNILLDTTKYDFERADALRNILAIDQEYFKNLDIEKMSLEQVKQALDNYIKSLVLLKNATKVNFGGLFDNLGKSLEVFTKETRIPTLFDKAFKGDEFDKITDGIKNFTERTGLSFEKWRQNIINQLTLTQAQQGVALSFDQIKAIIDKNVIDLNKKASELRLLDFLSGPAAETQAKRSKKFFDTILKNAEEFQKTVENNLQKPFRDFFDLIIEEGKISFDSFFELFKDLIKRIASQLIASGIAKLLTTALFPTAAVTDSPLQKVIKLLSGGAGFFKTAIPQSGVNNVNLGGVSSQGLQLAGEVVFVQRGSDLIGAINRTNATINRVG